MKKIIIKFEKNKVVLRNLFNLSLIQVFNLLAPLILYPLTIHRLGFNSMGIVVYYQGIIAFFAIFINYGFYIIGAKLISESYQNRIKLSLVVSTILLIKFIHWMISLFILIVVANISYFNLNIEYIILAFLSTFYELLFMQWFFQGIEKLKPMVLINSSSKIIQIFFIFYFINDSNDINIYFIIIAILNFITGFVSILIAFSEYKLKLILPNINYIKNIFISAGTLFLANITNSIKDRLSVLLIGNHINMVSVAYYDLAMRIVNISTLPINLITDAFFPSLVKKKSTKTIYSLCLFSLFISIFLVIIEFIFAEKIILILAGNINETSIKVVKLALIIVPILSISTVLGKLGLIASGRNKHFLYIVIKTVILYLIAVALGYKFGFINNIFLYVSISIFIYIIELLLRAFYLYRK
ncbi:oligosaccharide flippase family protein [Proteus cibarius]|uniref:oligosaccharide flippase family protein n=1 Tax=Proteus terrae TaxID=1574161 RepID=UPI00148D5BF3|nr:oligosaccharide flippase family protein [Proteus terrae]MBG6039392.1 oligosaccharide flippase family protein [Proteus terrae subsp. cibarius]MCW9690194.1 oligosaccharide flippase family protein [Proteus terrae]MDR9743603.1 oligosaccharide flippase family protein [Proteus terrae]QJW49445.1 oligosaccharide flippase family protein [Proteus terrae subsp. cibarius]